MVSLFSKVALPVSKLFQDSHLWFSFLLRKGRRTEKPGEAERKRCVGCFNSVLTVQDVRMGIHLGQNPSPPKGTKIHMVLNVVILERSSVLLIFPTQKAKTWKGTKHYWSIASDL